MVRRGSLWKECSGDHDLTASVWWKKGSRKRAVDAWAEAEGA